MIREILENINEAKTKKPQLIDDAVAWLKAKGYKFEAKDNKNWKAFKRASSTGQTELVFDNVPVTKEVMELLSTTKKFKNLYYSWGGFVVGIAWHVLSDSDVSPAGIHQ